MKIHRIRAFSLGSGIAIGLVMLALSPSPSLTAQKHHRQHAHHLSVQPRSSGYVAPVPAQELSPEAAWPMRKNRGRGSLCVTMVATEFVRAISVGAGARD